jgi:hypothetical protein
MNSSQNGGKSKSLRSKKGGNFLGSVGELVAPSGWESFATTAGLFALDRADAALRRGKSSAKKGGMRGGNPMEEARLIQQNNSNLIYAFLRLCGYAFIKENRDEIYKKLKTLLEKEIKYREKIIRLIQNEEMMTFLANSLIDLKYIYEFVDKFVDKTKNLNQKRKNYANYIGLGLYRNEYRQKHPNIKINDLPSHNKTLSNLEEKYSNNKYRN